MTVAEINSEIVRLTGLRDQLSKEVRILLDNAKRDMVEYNYIKCNQLTENARKRCYETTKSPWKVFAENKTNQANAKLATIALIDNQLAVLRDALTTGSQSAAEIGKILAGQGLTVQATIIEAGGRADREREKGRAEGITIIDSGKTDNELKAAKASDNRKKRAIIFAVGVCVLVVASFVIYKKYA